MILLKTRRGSSGTSTRQCACAGFCVMFNSTTLHIRSCYSACIIMIIAVCRAFCAPSDCGFCATSLNAILHSSSPFYSCMAQDTAGCAAQEIHPAAGITAPKSKDRPPAAAGLPVDELTLLLLLSSKVKQDRAQPEQRCAMHIRPKALQPHITGEYMHSSWGGMLTCSLEPHSWS